MLALIAALAAVAQPQTQVGPIVVEGRDAGQTATDYVEKLLPSTGMEAQFGRFEEPLCPKALGLTEDLAVQVANRVRDVARAANIDVAKGSCTPNLIIIAAADKKGMIATLRKSRPGYVNGVGSDELKRLGNSTRPYVGWQVTDVIAADGMPVGSSGSFPSPGSGARDAKGNWINGDYARLKTTVSPSRLRNPTRPRVLMSIVIVENSALTHATIRQLADFALVKAMTPTEQHEQLAPASSILSLFNPGVSAETGPQSVTWWDVAFLKSLTNTRSDSFADIQRSEIRDQMVREANKVPAGQ